MRFIIIDTETTGLTPDDVPWEIGALKVVSEEVAGFRRLIIANGFRAFLPITKDDLVRAEDASGDLDGTDKEGLFDPLFEAIEDGRVKIVEKAEADAARSQAVAELERFAHGSGRPVWAGINPRFDIGQLYRERGSFERSLWAYSPVDIKTWVLGVLGEISPADPIPTSDEVMSWLGVDPGDRRHTAMGDCEIALEMMSAALIHNRGSRVISDFMGGVRPGIDVEGCSPLVYAALGLAGEAGELADAVKKSTRRGQGLARHRDDIISEAGDVLFYWTRVLQEVSVDAADVIAVNEAKRRQRGLL